MTAVGPGPRELVAARDRSGGRGDGSEPRSPATYVETNTVILALAEIATALAIREREARAKLTIVEGHGGPE